MLKFLIRISSFFRKEIAEILRQPRLILTLILGPFLILLLFGVGYRNQARAVRALFVVPVGSDLTSRIQEYATSLGPHLIYEGVSQDESHALNRLRRNEVDMVVVVPADVETKIENNEQATFQLYHNEIDPAQSDYVNYLGQNYIDEVNRRVLSSYASEAQQESTELTADVRSARENARQMREALEAGNASTARARQQDLRQDVSTLNSSVQARMLFGALVAREVGQQAEEEDSLSNVAARLQALDERNSSTEEINAEDENFDTEIADLRETEQELEQIETDLAEFQSISPQILVRPFITETKSIAPISTLEPAIFFTPAVIAMILQHIAVTFGALSIIRERNSGTMELFRVSPITAGETLVGKYLSYMFLTSVLAGALSLLLYYVLGVPILGGWLNYAIVIVALIFTSLGFGFLISLKAISESQAVQLAMITLLVSVFFSGMFLDLRYLWEPVQVISWLTPATYGTILLQNVMLRGIGIGLIYITGLVAIGLLLFLISLRTLRKEMKLG